MSRTLVTVELRDGEVPSEERRLARGDFENPAGKDELLAKFRTLAGMRLEPDRIERLIGLVMAVESLAEVRELGAALKPNPVPATAGRL